MSIRICICLIYIFNSIQLAWSQEYPNRDIHVIVHTSPGGGTDNMARLVLSYASRKLHTKFIIENYKGAGGQVGYSVLARSEPDGYNIGTITTMSIVTHELTRKNVSYGIAADFNPVARVIMDPSALYVLTSDSVSSFDQLLEVAKSGEKLVNCAGSSYWGAQHVHVKLIEKLSGLEFNYIPFDGTSEVRNILLGKHVRVASGGISEFEALIRSGKVRPLVVASEERLPEFPNIPTFKELGFPIVVGSSRGFAFPQNVPEEHVELLSTTIMEVLADPKFLEDADRMGLKDFIKPLGADEFRKYLIELSDLMKNLVDDSGENKQRDDKI